MKISDILTEAVPVSAPSNVGRDYINMLNFVKSSGLENVPPDQQVAVALFKELQKQQKKNTQLGQELSAAERRIDQATASGELYGQELATHQAELDRERGEKPVVELFPVHRVIEAVWQHSADFGGNRARA